MSERDLLLPPNTPETDDVESQGRFKSSYRRWQSKTAWFLEHPNLHRAVITLIAIDAACVLADLGYSFLSSECAAPGDVDSPAWLEVLSHISLVITTLFLVEIPMSIWALGLGYMNPFGPVPHSTIHAFDAIIIITTFTLEIILRGKERELAGLLVILRLWRLVKLVGGVAVGAGEIEERTAELLSDTQAELTKTKADLDQARQENLVLRQKLGQFIQDS